jgi:large subunit ribosomal protein L31
MKENIHPKYEEINVICSCGETFKTKSTSCKDFKVDVCSKCHPFYSGQQKIVDTEGRVETFKKRFGQFARKK